MISTVDALRTFETPQHSNAWLWECSSRQCRQMTLAIQTHLATFRISTAVTFARDPDYPTYRETRRLYMEALQVLGKRATPPVAMLLAMRNDYIELAREFGMFANRPLEVRCIFHTPVNTTVVDGPGE